MCYAIPAKLISIEGHKGVIDYFGEQRNILLDPDYEVTVGDYVYAQGGIMVRKIPPKEAEKILDAWKDIFFELKKTDIALSKIDESKLSPNVLGVLQKVNLQKSLKRDEMLALMAMKQPDELAVLYEVANNVRQREHGNASCVHGIIEFSNYCLNNCHYCGLRYDRNVQRYRMSLDEILETAEDAVEKHGFKAIVLQSGEDYWYDETKLIRLVKEIKRMGVLIFLSIGLRSNATYEKLYNAGARAALIRFETSNAETFERLRPGTTLEKRLELIKYIKEIGYILATGFMVGLPGETDEDIINNILLTKYLAPDMYSFGPLIPTAQTPLAQTAKVSVDKVLKTIAISRFVDSGANILVTTALETADKNAKRQALLAGANSMMINITPEHYKKLYAIYDKRSGVQQSLGEAIKETVDLLYSLGRAPTDIQLSGYTKKS